MTSATKNVLLLMAGGVLTILILGSAGLFGSSLYRGTTTIPEGVQSQIWSALIGFIVVGTGAVTVYVNTKNAQLTRNNSNINAQITQGKVHETEQKVSELIHTVNDGLRTDIAEKVRVGVAGTAAEVAERLRVTQMEQNLIALTVKLDALLVGSSGNHVGFGPSPGGPVSTSTVQQGIDAVETNTKAQEAVSEQLIKIAENTAAVETNTVATDYNSESRKSGT